MLVSHIVPTIGTVKMRGVLQRVRAWHAKLPGTVPPAKCYRFLRAVLATVVDDEKDFRNPCKVAAGAWSAHPSVRSDR